MANSTPTVDLEAEEELYQRAFSKERNELLALKDRYITVTLPLHEANEDSHTK